jgi:hypothetical protein
VKIPVTPSQAPVSREEWEARLADFADKAIRFIKLSSAQQTQGSAKAAKELRDDTISSSNTILDSIMALQAEVERLGAIVSEVHSMAVQAGIRGEFVPTDFIRAAIEKARQPK